ncbi:MAG: hypothetical protein OCD01_14600, partial [Fibrobacterales bacterium]
DLRQGVLGGMKSLTYIYVAHNNLSGVIPNSLLSLLKLNAGSIKIVGNQYCYEDQSAEMNTYLSSTFGTDFGAPDKCN